MGRKVTSLRWRLDDDVGPAGQEALFPRVERHVGKGEYRGLEFFHVQASSIINTLPSSSRLPFRHTINAYRGCSHACTYCFARPTHDYLGLDIAEGFERQIVVKVNAVERLRAELRPSRWAGEPIAMGTNTDPYQRAEGRYRLTRGLVKVLGDAGNPFSILTKSTLVLRDLDVLAAAAARTDVSVTFSIGTLDEEVWRATEPGTPHPRQRVAALTRLARAGIRCGVLVAPVLPGLSDGADQIEEVVAACAEAGADSISGGMVLYLKPGTREVFLDHLGRTHPELLARYERLYGRTRVGKDVQARVSGLLRDSLARHRPSAVAVSRPRSRATPRSSRTPAGPVSAPAAPAGPPEPRQLGLPI